MIRIFYFILFYFLSSVSISQNPKIEIDFEESSPMLSIELETKRGAEVPTRYPSIQSKQMASMSILASLFSQLNRTIVNYQIEEKVNNYLLKLNSNLLDGTGQLIKLTYFIGNDDNIYFSDNVFGYLGIGSNPIDAFSEYLNHPKIFLSSPDANMKEMIIYKWIKKEDGKLLIFTIPSHLNQKFYKDSNRLAIEKIKMKDKIYRTYKSSIPDFSVNVQKWNDRIKSLENERDNFERVEKMKILTRDYERLQSDFKKIKFEYEDLKLQQSSQNTFLETINTLLEIGSSLSEVYGENETVSQNVTYSPTIIKNQLEIVNNNLIKKEAEIEKQKSAVEKKETELEKFYNSILD